MPHRASKESRYDERSRPERTIEATDKLLRETVGYLSRQSHAHAVGVAACDSLLDLRPHLEDGLSALADIEQSRELTDQEASWQRAFRIALVAST